VSGANEGREVAARERSERARLPEVHGFKSAFGFEAGQSQPRTE